MLDMLNDPDVAKLVIYALAGICAVLAVAVIVLAVKRNVYYVDDEGNEVPPDNYKPKKSLFSKKKEEEPAPVEAVVPAAEPVPEPEPAEVPAAEEPAEEEEDVLVWKPQTVEEEVQDEADEPMLIEPEEESLAEVPEEAEATTVLDVPSLRAVPSMLEEIDSSADTAAEEPAEEEPAAPPVTGAVVTVTVGDRTEEYRIETLPCLIGRESDACDLVISEPAVSRRHARMYESEGRLYIEDVSGHNGTFVNGVKLASLGRQALKELDRINLGRAEIVVAQLIY